MLLYLSRLALEPKRYSFISLTEEKLVIYITFPRVTYENTGWDYSQKTVFSAPSYGQNVRSGWEIFWITFRLERGI